MSRTYRRKKEKAPRWVTENWQFVWRDLGNGYQWREHVRIPIKGVELKKVLAQWHSDSMWLQYPPTKEFRRDFGHKYDRQKTKHAIHKEMYAIERGDVIFDKPRNIDWLWW